MGFFITLEGPEGSGKSTQMGLLAEYLRERGYDVVTSREPGGTSIGDQIRGVLHDTRNTEMTPTAEVLLYSASRAQLVEQLIRPALANNKIVLLDRYADSTLAYQGFGRGLDLSQLASLTAIATRGLLPDLTILLDLDVTEGLNRRREQGDEMNRLDLETIDFHNRVRNGYHELVGQGSERWVTVNAGQPIADVQAELCQIVISRLESKVPISSH